MREKHHPDEAFRAPLLWLLIPLALGIVAARCGIAAPPLAGTFAAAALAAGSIAAAGAGSAKGRTVWALTLGTAMTLTGLLLMQRVDRRAPRWEHLPPREIDAEIEVNRLFRSADPEARLLCLGTFIDVPPLLDDLRGHRTFLAVDVPKGSGPILPTARIRVRGVLHPLAAVPPKPGSFDAYLLAQAVLFRISRAQLVETLQPANRLEHFRHAAEEKFRHILAFGLPPDLPAAGAYSAMMLGRRSELSPEQKHVFLQSGTMHLFAISGLHIGVIALILATMFTVCRVPRLPGMIFGLLALSLFVEATGGTPSERRALLMIAFLWTGTALARPANPLSSLAAAATVVLVADPLALFTTSFQLSYAVVGSILLYGIPLKNWIHQKTALFRDIPLTDWRAQHHFLNQTVRWAGGLFSISLAAMLVSAPLGLEIFGIVAPSALLTALAVMPLAGLAITAGFLSLAAGLAGWLPLSSLFNHAAVVLLILVSKIARVAAATPWGHFSGAFPVEGMGRWVAVTILAWMLAGYARGWDRMPGRLWLPPTAVVIGMVFLVSWH